MMCVPALTMSRRKPSHEFGEHVIAIGPKKQVPVIGHQTECQDSHLETLPGLFQQAEKRVLVLVFLE